MEEQEIILEVENNQELEIIILEEEIKEIKPDYKQISITPTIETQVFKGAFDKITVEGDNNLIPQNIVEGIKIFGVEGTVSISGGVLNVFVQEKQPEFKEGFWISLENTINEVHLVNNIDIDEIYTNNSLIIKKGNRYKTNLLSNPNKLNGDMQNSFDEVYYTDENGKIILDVDIYYGNGENWISIFNYRELEYVMFDGNQYLDTLYPLLKSNNWKTEIQFNMTKLYNYNHIFSVSDEDTLNEIWVNSSGIYSTRLTNSSTKYEYPRALNRDIDYTIIHNCIDNIIYTTINDISAYAYDMSNSSHPNQSLRFGKRETGYFLGKLYYFKMWDNNVLVRYFVPIIDMNTDKCYLLDKVNNELYISANLNDFIPSETYKNSNNDKLLINIDYLFIENKNFNNFNKLIEQCGKISSMQNTFLNASWFVEKIDLSSLDMSNLIRLMGSFSYISKLKELRGFKNLGKAYTEKMTNYGFYQLNLSSATNLSYESLLDIINNIYDLNVSYNVKEGGTLYSQALTLGSSNKAKLTAEEIAIATAKGWSVN